MTGKTLIAYVTRMGATAEYAKIIAEVFEKMHGIEVDVVDLKKREPDLSEYDNVVIGTSITIGRWPKQAMQLLEKDFEGKKVAVFVSSSKAGDPKFYDQAYQSYLKDVLSEHPNLQPVAIEAFGGIVRIFGYTASDARTPDRARNWADRVGYIFKGEE